MTTVFKILIRGRATIFTRPSPVPGVGPTPRRVSRQVSTRGGTEGTADGASRTGETVEGLKDKGPRISLRKGADGSTQGETMCTSRSLLTLTFRGVSIKLLLCTSLHLTLNNSSTLTRPNRDSYLRDRKGIVFTPFLLLCPHPSRVGRVKEGESSPPSGCGVGAPNVKSVVPPR